MKKVHLILAVSILLLYGIFGITYSGAGQAPEPTPAAGAVDEPPLPGMDNSNIPGPDTNLGPVLNGGSCMLTPVFWEVKASLPVSAFGVGVASDGQYVYAAGGGGTSVYFDTLHRYNPAADQWVVLNPMPTPVSSALVIYAEGKLFVIGGIGSGGVLNSVQIYTISSGVWSSGSALPSPRQQMGGGYHNGKIYAVGGYQTGAVSSVQNQVWEYTLASNSWAVRASLPSALAGPGSGVVNGSLYILGGRDASHDALNTAYKYDISANSWSSVANLLTAVNFPGSTVYNDRIWLFGGGVPFSTASLATVEMNGLNVTQVYDPATNIWVVGPNLNVGRSFQGGAVVHNQIVSVGGWSSAGASAAVEVLKQQRMKVLIIYADGGALPTRLQFDLMKQPDVGQVDVFDGHSGTPNLDQLQNYDIVVPFSNSNFLDRELLGDVIADYQDGGGTVVGFVFDWTATIGIGGRWLSGGYSPFNGAANTVFSASSLGAYTSGHPLMKNVAALNAYYRLRVSLAAGAVQVASWTDGWPLIAAKGRAIGVNAYVGDYSNNWSGDFARVIANAGNWLWLGNHACDVLACSLPSVFVGSISDTDSLLPGRLVRSEPGGTCAEPQTCAVNDANPHHFDAYNFWNNDINPQCVTVTLDAGNCVGATFIQSSAYLGSFDPANLCANFLADIGGSPTPVKSYSFTVPAWQSYTVIVNEVIPNSYCASYLLRVSSGDCRIKNSFTPLILRNSP